MGCSPDACTEPSLHSNTQRGNGFHKASERSEREATPKRCQFIAASSESSEAHQRWWSIWWNGSAIVSIELWWSICCDGYGSAVVGIELWRRSKAAKTAISSCTAWLQQYRCSPGSI